MIIDGKENVKERIKIYENKYFITYLYIFENGNSYRETKPKWIQKDFYNYKLSTEPVGKHKLNSSF